MTKKNEGEKGKEYRGVIVAMAARENLIAARSTDFASSFIVIASKEIKNPKHLTIKTPKKNKKKMGEKRRYPCSRIPKSLLL